MILSCEMSRKSQNYEINEANKGNQSQWTSQMMHQKNIVKQMIFFCHWTMQSVGKWNISWSIFLYNSLRDMASVSAVDFSFRFPSVLTREGDKIQTA